MEQWIKQLHTITPRRPKFDFSETPAHWLADDPLGSQMLNILNPLTPAAERWFCRTFRDALPLIEDEALKEAAKAFIKQEGAHSHGHTLGNRLLQEQGINLQPYLKLMDWLFDDMLGPNPLGHKLKNRRAQRAWLSVRLAMVAATEHLTGVLGHWILNADALSTAPADPVMLHLYRWHGAEEIEHREVADALFRSVSGNNLLRTGAALTMFPLFGALGISAALYLVRNDPALPHALRVQDYLRAVRQGRMPGPSRLLSACARYLAPNHSPLTEGSTEQALAYLDSTTNPEH